MNISANIAVNRLLILLALGSLMAAVSLAAIPDPVKTDSGSVAGTSNTDASVRMFKGIPFAAPPVGDLRWKVAQPLVKWEGVKMATEFSPTCANGAGGGRGRGGGGSSAHPRVAAQPKVELRQVLDPARIACTSTYGRPRNRPETSCP